MIPLINGEKERSYDNIYGAYINTQRMVVEGDYKLIAYPQLKKFKLFNLKKDRLEMDDLASNPEFAEKLAEMKLALEEAMDEMSDPMDSISKANYPENLMKTKGKKH